MPPAHGAPSSPRAQPAKRQRHSSSYDDDAAPRLDGSKIVTTSPRTDTAIADSSPGPAVAQSSNFRNVSACNRCRLRKNRCDQKLPSCASCAKAGLERLLKSHDIDFPAAQDLDPCSRPSSQAVADTSHNNSSSNHTAVISRPSDEYYARPPPRNPAVESLGHTRAGSANKSDHQSQSPAMSNIISSSNKTDKSLASASGVSFARVVFAAVQYAVSDQNNGNGANQPQHQRLPPPSQTNPNVSSSSAATAAAAGGGGGRGGGTSMRDSFFGLHTKPTIQPATFPTRNVGMHLVMLYFEHANPQIPILHRGEFLDMFERAYSDPENGRGHRESYMLNMVFAIGCGVIVGEPVKTETSDTSTATTDHHQSANSGGGGGGGQCKPEEYHASAIVHLEACLSSSGGGLEVLQAVLLLANFALLRPVPPGLWYIIGVAVRLAIDLGLHHEDGGLDVPDSSPLAEPTDSGAGGEDNSLGGGSSSSSSSKRRDPGGRQGSVAAERGRRLWTRDMRRRLWWCTYSFDRLVSTCVGRPFGVADDVITTGFPSLLDDDYISPTVGIVEQHPHNQAGKPSAGGEDIVVAPSYKKVAHHYFRLRMLQSEMVQVLQYNQSQAARVASLQQQHQHQQQDDAVTGGSYPEMHMHHLPSPFLVQFDSFRSWRRSIDERLYSWKMSAPTRLETGVAFSTEFLELNYWQAIILLYRQSLSVPAMFEDEYNTSHEVDDSSPRGGGGSGGGASATTPTTELLEDEDRIYLKVAEAGQKILRIYRQLHLSGLVSYTYLSTHHLFMAGISYLYAIWHSPPVRARLTMDEVDFTVLAAKSVFTDMIDKCPPAETCRDAFDRTARTTIKMAMSNGGFGAQAQAQAQSQPKYRQTAPPPSSSAWMSGVDPSPANTTSSSRARRRNNILQHQHQHQHQQDVSPQQQRPFRFDLSISDTLSSPPLSAAGEVGSRASPNMSGSRSATYEADYMMHTTQDGRSPSDHGLTSTAQNSNVYSTSTNSMSHGHNHHNPSRQQYNSGGGGSTVQGTEYPELDFFESLDATSNYEFTGMDQAQVNLGFGMNWEGLGNEYGDSHPANPFDSFFFGPQGNNGHDNEGMGL
ncbi:Fungal trans [Geosmithia morbida]|uniref:Fungal trans n=1 Tax=Geosmithia morbida TaxID=1094350 RepID=A0A9P4Z2Y3_9HYPO|nr:Fungal trans [Geosmithia morbida]KAF4126745.1 Fungal trans [Geosmithia morbida]